MPMMQRAVLAAAAGLAGLALLVGCAPEATVPTTSPTAEPSKTPAPAPTVTAERVFVPPASCTALLGPTLEGELLAGGDVLFSAPDGTGLYPGTPSTQPGTPFSCWYGRDMVDLSTYEVAAQPQTPQQHEGTLAVLQSEGHTQTDVGEVVIFSSAGDEGTKPAILHELHPDGWITMYSSLGGDERLKKMRARLVDIRANLYPKP